VKEIKMVDLYGQYLKIKDEIDREFAKIFQNTSFINGPQVHEFSFNLAEYLGARHVIPCANGTDALQIAMMALDLKPGDEVITSPFTFIATAEVVSLLHLKPVFVDVEENTFNLNPELIEKAITPKTKAIVPVHLFGQCADMESIMKIAERYNLFVIEDNAQALGADYFFSDGSIKEAGTIGHIGCTSFFPSKNLGGYGDGGALFTDDDALAEKISMIVNHGMKVRYYHDMVGINSRLDTLQAAILKVKLKYLDEYIAARQKAADFYNKAFEHLECIVTPYIAPYTTHVFHQYTVKLKNCDRTALIDYLKINGIPAMIYYPVPLHLQRAFLPYGFKEGDFSVSEKLCQEVISLPMHTELDEEQMNYICEKIKLFIDKSY